MKTILKAIIAVFIVSLLSAQYVNADSYTYNYTDNFSDNNLNTKYWSNATGGSGTTNEINERYEIFQTKVNDAGILYTKNTYHDYDVSAWLQFNGVIAGNMGVYLYGRNNTPTVGKQSMIIGATKAGIAADFTTQMVRIFYQTNSNTFMYWNQRLYKWQTDTAGTTLSLGAWVNFSIIRNGTDYKFIFGNTRHKLMETSWISSYDMKDGGYSDHIVFGDPSENTNNMDMFVDNYTIKYNNFTWKDYSYQDGQFIFEKDDGRHVFNTTEWWYGIYHFNTTKNNQYSLITIYNIYGEKSTNIYNRTSNNNILRYYSKSVPDYFSMDTTKWNLAWGLGSNQDVWRATGGFKFYQKIVTTSDVDRKVYKLSINTTAERPPILHRYTGFTPGWISMGYLGSSAYYSLTNLSIDNGTFCIDAACETITGGSGWYDRQWGNWSRAGHDGWDWFAIQMPGKEMAIWNMYDALAEDRVQYNYYAINYGANESKLSGNYTTNDTKNGITFDIYDYNVDINGNIKTHGLNVTIPSENITLRISPLNSTIYTIESPYLMTGKWGKTPISGYTIGETLHAWHEIRRNKFTISSLIPRNVSIPVNHTNNGNSKILNGSSISWKNQIYANQANITLHGYLHLPDTVSTLNLSIIPNSGHINVTMNVYNSKQIKFNATKSIQRQNMNVTAYNDVFFIVNGKAYNISKNGIVQQTVIAANGSVSFQNIIVGRDSDYQIYPALSSRN